MNFKPVALMTFWVFLGGPGLACKNTPPPASQTKETEKNAILSELASAYGASAGWEEAVRKGPLDEGLTIDLQERLVHSDRPVVFRGRLADIRRTPAGVLAVFEPPLFGPHVYFRLLVPEKLVEPLRAAPRERFISELAGVAVVRNVRRPIVELDAEPMEDSYSIEPRSADFFVADGDLVAFRNLE